MFDQDKYFLKFFSSISTTSSILNLAISSLPLLFFDLWLYTIKTKSLNSLNKSLEGIGVISFPFDNAVCNAFNRALSVFGNLR